MKGGEIMLPYIQQILLTPNLYSRPQLPLKQVKKLVIHWVANPGSSALANRNYFENLKAGTRGIYASSHYLVGLDGEVIQCIPDTEVAYHAKNANTYSLGIEVCHIDSEGQFSPTTYASLIELCTHLCYTYTLDPATALIRHYDVTGKVCPKYYVQHPAQWRKLKEDIVAQLNANYLQVYKNIQPQLINIQLNETLKQISAFLNEGHYYVKLRDLEDSSIEVGYDEGSNIPTLNVRNKLK